MSYLEEHPAWLLLLLLLLQLLLLLRPSDDVAAADVDSAARVLTARA